MKMSRYRYVWLLTVLFSVFSFLELGGWGKRYSDLG